LYLDQARKAACNGASNSATMSSSNLQFQSEI
jgi:hypothetical protein